MSDRKHCINCQRELVTVGTIRLCPACNSSDLTEIRLFLDGDEDTEYAVIECPGATHYDPDTNEIIKGVRWHNDDDPTQGYEIVDEQIFAPTHRRFRRIKRDALGNIRRCQGCQDYTIRMRRREGPDFFIPSARHPNRKKLKSVEYTTRR
ncbi:hypothetical protein GF420_05400 [candidate division GN15 bacterium]|nr:hypothetical protein [candidate division GN15 bacterium]